MPTRRGNVMARMRMIATLRSRRAVQGAPARHGQQDRAAARLLHLARRRRAAGESARRSVQDAGARARAAPGRSRAQSSTRRRRADLVHGQTDEGDLGISYDRGRSDSELDSQRILADEIVARGFDAKASRHGATTRLDSHTLEAPAVHGRDAQRHRDRRELPAAGGLLAASEAGRRDAAKSPRVH